MGVAQSWEVVGQWDRPRFRDEQRTSLQRDQPFVLALAACGQFDRAGDRLGGAVATAQARLCRGADDGWISASTDAASARELLGAWDTGTEHPNQLAVGLPKRGLPAYLSRIPAPDLVAPILAPAGLGAGAARLAAEIEERLT